MAETLDGGLVLLYYGDTDDIDEAKSIVCETDSGFDGSRTTNAVDTKCGILKSLGRQNNKISGNGLTNIEPGPMEGSFQELLELYRLGTKQFFWYRDVDDHVFISGEGWFNNIGNQNKSGESSSFSYTLEIDGDISTTAESPVSASYDTALTFASSVSDDSDGVGGTVGSTDADLKFEFDAITPQVGTPASMTIEVDDVEVIVIDFPTDYTGQPFRFTDAAGVVHNSSAGTPATGFYNGTVNF